MPRYQCAPTVGLRVPCVVRYAELEAVYPEKWDVGVRQGAAGCSGLGVADGLFHPMTHPLLPLQTTQCPCFMARTCFG